MRHKVHSASPDIITLERFRFEFLQNVNVSSKFKQKVKEGQRSCRQVSIYVKEGDTEYMR